MASIIAATVLMGLLLLAVALAVGRGTGGARRAVFLPTGLERRSAERRSLRALASHPATWVAGFLLLALGATGVAIVAVGGFGLSIPGGTTAVGAVFGLLVALFLLAGSYVAVRERDVSPAGALLASSLVAALLVLTAITGLLVGG